MATVALCPGSKVAIHVRAHENHSLEAGLRIIYDQQQKLQNAGGGSCKFNVADGTKCIV